VEALLSIINSNIRLTGPTGRTRPAAVAGHFYPDDPAVLSGAVRSMLAGARARGPVPKALIVPHAGYVYSGSVAASAYANLAAARDRIRRVVLLGPAHRVYLKGLALSSAHRFDTPLGPVEIDVEAAARVRGLPQVSVMDAAHAQEHSLEVHLPFLQTCLAEFRLVPLVVGDASPAEVAQVLHELWGGDETLVVISSDLSHYHDYDTARQLDTATCRAIEGLQLEDIGPQEACGCMPIRGLLKLADARKFKVRLLDLRNSGDTAGPRDRVVGYAAFGVFADSDTPQHDDARHLLGAARDSIRRGLQNGTPLLPDPGNFPDPLRRHAGVFVTLTRNGMLRGCIGSLEAREPLIVGVARHAFAAAFQDPRFPPLNVQEFSSLTVSVSILSAAEPLLFENERELIARLRPGVDGLIIERGARRSTFLPSVWETLPSAAEFMLQLKRKAGIADQESPERAWRYITESVSE
jgi:hypothetical protein